MPYQSFMDYFYDVQTKIHTNKLVKQENIDIRPTVNPNDKWRGAIIAEIEFKKGGKLKILEKAEINYSRDQVNILEYSYGYFGKYKEDQGFFFRYESSCHGLLRRLPSLLQKPSGAHASCCPTLQPSIRVAWRRRLRRLIPSRADR